MWGCDTELMIRLVLLFSVEEMGLITNEGLNTTFSKGAESKLAFLRRRKRKRKYYLPPFMLFPLSL